LGLQQDMLVEGVLLKGGVGRSFLIKFQRSLNDEFSLAVTY
jgi:hypothetical protein